MRKLFLSAIALLGLTAQSAFATNLEFQFDVNSSGPSMYACNVGIKHGAETRICYDSMHPTVQCTQACAAGDSSQCGPDTSPATCACTGETTTNEGGLYMDFADVTSGPWLDNQTATNTANETNTKLSTGWNNPAGNSLFPSLTDAYTHQIRNLSLNLGSEQYGAEYYVDICYRGPQIDYTGVTPLNFDVVAKVTVTNLKASTNYEALSGLNVQAETKCIMSDAFNYCNADATPGSGDSCTSPIALANHQSVAFRASGPLAANQNTLYDLNLGSIGGQRVPRFCYTRYTFSEKSHKVRQWKSQKAKVCTYTQISEPSL